jgi:hypothetical protein
LGRTRFGYAFASCLFLAGLFTFLTQRLHNYEGAGSSPILYFIAAGILALAVVGASLLSVGLMLTTTLAAPGWKVDPAANAPIADFFPGMLRLLAPFLNVTGGLALAFGAVFSAYVFMPKRRILDYSLDPNQPGDQFLFNLAISPVAITVNFVASLPGAVRALLACTAASRPRSSSRSGRSSLPRATSWLGLASRASSSWGSCWRSSSCSWAPS